MGSQDQTLQRDDDLTALWRQAGELIRGQSRQDVRFDRVEAKLDHIEGDVAVLKTDIAVLKTDVAVLTTDVAVLKTDVAVVKTDIVGTKEQLGRLGRATESRFNRIDAQLERLIALIQRAETKQP